MRTVEQERHEAIYKALARPSQVGLWVCIGTTILLVFVFSVMTSFLGSDLPSSWPRWLVFLLFMLPFAAAVIVLPNLAQLLVIRGDSARAIEALNAYALGERADYTARTGRKIPFFMTVGSARRWLSKGEGHGTRLRVRALITAGELDAASQVLAGMPAEDPVDAFHRSLQREILEFVATGTMNPAGPRAELERIPPSPERDHAILALAIEESRLDLARGLDPIPRVARAREQVTAIPRGASIRERLLAALPYSAGFFAIFAVVTWVIT